MTDFGIDANETILREVAKLLPQPELLTFIASIKADYISRLQVEQAHAGIDALALSIEKINQLQENFLSIEKLCQECQTLPKNHDKIKLLNNARNNLNSTIKVIIDFQAAEKHRLEEPASVVGLERLCAMINNNLRCYELSTELSNSMLEALPQNNAEQVNFEDTCKGFLLVAKEAVHKTVNVIFEDPGVQELLVKLYQKDWLEGMVTEYLVATFGDYFEDVKMYIEERSFIRFVEACLEETIVVYIDHLLTQKNHIKEEMIERMRLDEEVLMDFFREYISVSKVETRVKILGQLRELSSAETLDSSRIIYTNILEHQPDCPPEVVEKFVALREGMLPKDAKKVVQECKEIYENSHSNGNPPRAGFVFGRVNCLVAPKDLWRKLAQ